MWEYGDDEVSVSVSFTCESCEHENEDTEQVVSKGDGDKIVICENCDAENTYTFEPPEPPEPWEYDE